MAKKMLIDATHPEETRVVVVDGNKVEEFDFETVNKRQLAGNIYLAKVTRVEPSLQAAFVDYGGNRHGFPGLRGNPPGLLPDPGRRPQGADRGRARSGPRRGGGGEPPLAPPPPRPTPRAERAPADPAVSAQGPSGMAVIDLDEDAGMEVAGKRRATQADRRGAIRRRP
jgi:ribonuclease E